MAALLVLGLSVGAAVSQGGDDGLDELGDRGALGSLRNVRSSYEPLGLASLALATPEARDATHERTRLPQRVQGSSAMRVREDADHQRTTTESAFLAGYPEPFRSGAALVIGGIPGVCTGESNWNAQAIGSAGERGLMQIAPVHRERIAALGYSWSDMLLTAPNIAVGWSIYSEQGWAPWRWSKECHGLS